MIRNLNQQNFKGFGAISPERAAAPDIPSFAGSQRTLQLKQGRAPILLSKSEVCLSPGSGSTMLSVSKGGEEFRHFYLDKPVRIHPGIRFCVSPFQQNTSQVELSADVDPEDTGAVCPVGDLHMSGRMQVTALYTFFYQEKEKGFFFPGEAHAMPELTYVDQGTLHSVADGQDLLLGQGDLVIYAPGQWHMQYADIDVAPRYITVSFDMAQHELSILANRKLRITQQGAALLEQMLREYDRMDTYSPDIIIALLTQLLLTLLRNGDAPVAGLQTVNSIHSENEMIRRAQQYISAHIREKLSVPMVARKVDVSSSYLTALFHKHLQISPGEYIRRTKLQESKQMIREGSMNFTEIAAALHYSTIHHFSRQFKDKFGITPSEYARSVRE